MSEWTFVHWLAAVVVAVVGAFMVAVQILLLISADRAREDLKGRDKNE